ncbi:hypothetical protein R8Z57_14740 [Microbacterium sp. M3]|uniref:Multidrug transporter n=1 Tax=Microbacterium arthrosphaerae TaxID=792652 RepID=A0ABU4H462_9MICO|nr:MULTISPECIES: hypothetical protein [Microbacterium]MDW4574035.1 hypothetical protein [Microbacterium arthrosphaerae]MDW7607890.1 hypothetical protein [Microbacterium sp. M3]
MDHEDRVDSTGMTDDEKRHDQLTSAPNAVECDADPRIDVTHRDGVTRIDIRDDADVRPGDPTKDPQE